MCLQLGEALNEINVKIKELSQQRFSKGKKGLAYMRIFDEKKRKK